MLYNARRKSIDTKLVTDSKRFNALNSNPRFKECYPIDENKLIVNLLSDKIESNYPLFVGWYILELSKLCTCDLCYSVLKDNYGKFVTIVYMGIDSLILEFKNIDVYKEMQNGALKEHMNLSSFPTNHFLYSEENKGKLVLLNSEISNNHISEVNCGKRSCSLPKFKAQI